MVKEMVEVGKAAADKEAGAMAVAIEEVEE